MSEWPWSTIILAVAVIGSVANAMAGLRPWPKEAALFRAAIALVLLIALFLW